MGHRLLILRVKIVEKVHFTKIEDLQTKVDTAENLKNNTIKFNWGLTEQQYNLLSNQEDFAEWILRILVILKINF